MTVRLEDGARAAAAEGVGDGRKARHKRLKSAIQRLGSDAEKVREVLLPELLPEAAVQLKDMLSERNRWGRSTSGSRFALRTVLELARLVSAQPQIAVAIFAKLGVQNQAELEARLGLIQQAEQVAPGQQADIAARVLREYVNSHPLERARLLEQAFGFSPVEDQEP